MPQTSKKYSEPLTVIIKSMLSKNPDDRPTAKKILQNPFIKQHIMQLLDKTKIKYDQFNERFFFIDFTRF
jgi:NIMA (never in mitosis gene a)-related kinase